VNTDKLALVQHICKGPVFKDSAARQSVLAAIMKTIGDFLNPEQEEASRPKSNAPKKIQALLGMDKNAAAKNFDEVCVQIILSMLQVVQEDDDKLCVERMSSLLPFLVAFVNKQLKKMEEVMGGGGDDDTDKFRESLSNGATALFSLLYLMDNDQYRAYINTTPHGSPGARAMLLEVRARERSEHKEEARAKRSASTRKRRERSGRKEGQLLCERTVEEREHKKEARAKRALSRGARAQERGASEAGARKGSCSASARKRSASARKGSCSASARKRSASTRKSSRLRAHGRGARAQEKRSRFASAWQRSAST
jgi:hypothetical protein